MRKRDELTNPTSCLNKARDDEWIFVLLQRDESAVDAVRAWIESRIQKGKNKRTDLKIQEAEGWIEAILAEQQAKQSFSPSAIPDPRGTHD